MMKFRMGGALLGEITALSDVQRLGSGSRRAP
jgi:hypothetical protein